jgi:FxsC-like protein
MSYRFFLSHARRDVDRYLRRFHDELVKEVAQRTAQWVDTGFRDARDLERGDWWETKLGTALSQSQVLVFLASPTSIASPWCGKEWAGFHRRCVDYQVAHHLPTPPKLIIPIIWVPTPSPPPVLSSLQSHHEAYGLDEVGDVYKEKGLLQLLKQRPRLYVKFLDQLAQEIVEAAQKQPLTDHPYPANFSTLESAFPPLKPDRFCARFIYVVARSAEVSNWRTKLDAYSDDTKQWRPFYPPSESDAATIAYQAALQENFNYEDAPLGSHLADEIKQAASDCKVLVFMVDAWALKIPKYRDLLEPFEQQRGKNCVVVVHWNLKDSETSSNSAALWQTLLTTLRKATIPEDRASDPDELHSKLVRGLIQGRKNLLEVGTLRDGLPEGNVALPPISAVKEG